MDLSVATIANIAGWALVGSGALIGLRALCLRRQAKPGCPQCGYDLTSLIAPESTAMPLCPECGHTARSLTHLSRGPVKRRLILIAASLALSSNLIFAIPRVASAGPVGLIPTFALALIHPYWDPTDTPNDSFLLDEMRRRAKDHQLWSPAAELWVLRTELSFWPSSRWGISRAQQATGPLPTLPPPTNFTAQPMGAWAAALEGAASRPVRIDAPGFAALGMDPAALTIANPTDRLSGSCPDSFAVTQQMTDALAAPTNDGCLIAHRGTLVITPQTDLAPFRVVSSYAAMPGLSPEETASFIRNAIQPMDWFENGGDRADLTFLGSRIMVLASETTHQEIQTYLALSEQRTPTPWAPIAHPSLAKACATQDRLRTTLINPLPDPLTLRAAASAISAATGIAVAINEDALESFSADQPLEPASAPATAHALLDAVLEQWRALERSFGDEQPPAWTILTDGSILIGAGNSLVAADRPALMVYDLKAMLDQLENAAVPQDGQAPSRTSLRDQLLSDLTLAAYPSQWTVNGGDLVQAQWAADRLHVLAPMRHHVRLGEFIR